MSNFEKIDLHDVLSSKEINLLKKYPKLASKIAKKEWKLALKKLWSFNLNKIKHNRSYCAMFQIYAKWKWEYNWKIDGNYSKEVETAFNNLKNKVKLSKNMNKNIEKILHKNKLTKSEVKNLCKIVSKKTNVPSDILFKLCKHENQWFKPWLVNSSTKAMWLTQVTPTTWERMEETYNIKLNKHNPLDQVIMWWLYLKHIKNIKKCSYKEALAYFNTWENFFKISKKLLRKYYSQNPAITQIALKLSGINVNHPNNRYYLYKLAKAHNIINSHKKYFNAAVIYYNS